MQHMLRVAAMQPLLCGQLYKMLEQQYLTCKQSCSQRYGVCLDAPYLVSWLTPDGEPKEAYMQPYETMFLMVNGTVPDCLQTHPDVLCVRQLDVIPAYIDFEMNFNARGTRPHVLEIKYSYCSKSGTQGHEDLKQTLTRCRLGDMLYHDHLGQHERVAVDCLLASGATTMHSRPRTIQCAIVDIEIVDASITCACVLIYNEFVHQLSYSKHFPYKGETAWHTAVAVHCKWSDKTPCLVKNADSLGAQVLCIVLARSSGVHTRRTSRLIRLAGVLAHACLLKAQASLACDRLLTPCDISVARVPVHNPDECTGPCRHRYDIVLTPAHTAYDDSAYVAAVTLGLVHGLGVRPRPVDVLYNHALNSDLAYLHTALLGNNVDVQPFIYNKSYTTQEYSFHRKYSNWASRNYHLSGVTCVDTQVCARRSIRLKQQGHVSCLPLCVKMDGTGPDSLSNLCMHNLYMHKQRIDYTVYNTEMINYCVKDCLLMFCLQASQQWIEQLLLTQEFLASFADEVIFPLNMQEQYPHSKLWQKQLAMAYAAHGKSPGKIQFGTCKQKKRIREVLDKTKNASRHYKDDSRYALCVLEIDIASAYPSAIVAYNIDPCAVVPGNPHKVKRHLLWHTQPPGGDWFERRENSQHTVIVSTFKTLLDEIKAIDASAGTFQKARRSYLKLHANAMIGCMRHTHPRLVQNVWGAVKDVVARLEAALPSHLATHIMTVTDAVWFGYHIIDELDCSLTELLPRLQAFHAIQFEKIIRKIDIPPGFTFTFTSYVVFMRHETRKDSYCALKADDEFDAIVAAIHDEQIAKTLITRAMIWKGGAYNSHAQCTNNEQNRADAVTNVYSIIVQIWL